MKNSRSQDDQTIVRNQLSSLITLQQSIGKINIVNPRTHETEGSIGQRCQKITLKNYAEVFDEIEKERGYSVALSDDSMISFYYEFENNMIAKHEISYLPNYRDGLDYERYQKEIDVYDLIDRIKNYLRIDYDMLGFKEYVHAKVHAHFGLGRGPFNLRLPLAYVVYPFDFMFFILKYIYNVDEGELNSLSFERDRIIMLTENEKRKAKLILSD